MASETKMMKIIFFCFALLTFSHISDGLRILNIFPTFSKSHNNLGEGINMHLLNAGHEVTFITPFLKNNTHPRLRQINITEILNILPEDRFKLSSLQLPSSYQVLMIMYMCSVMTTENEHVQKLMHDPNERFDLVIVDWMFNDVVFNGLAKVFDAPLVWVLTMEPHWAAMRFIDEAFHPAYSSDMMSSNQPPFTFWQRVQELWFQIKVTFYLETIFHFFDARAYNQLIAPAIKARGMEPPSPQELRCNASMMFGNSHVSFGEAHRLPVNYIPVGGFHINYDVKPLPEDLKNIMDNAKNGVIYFSMGSLIQSKDLPNEVKKALVIMFGTLKQTVIWKFEEKLSYMPKNVHILKWAPQQSILAHPNCVLFITHGGLLSTMEAIHFSVPIVGVPVFADQFNNIDKAVSKGIAKRVDLTMSPAFADALKAAVDEVLENSKYQSRVDEVSKIFHDRPVKPGAEIVHWVEHVVKTRGALHMRSPALMVPWYQKMYLDLLALLVSVLVALRFLYKKLIRRILFKKTESKKKSN